MMYRKLLQQAALQKGNTIISWIFKKKKKAAKLRGCSQTCSHFLLFMFSLLHRLKNNKTSNKKTEEFIQIGPSIEQISLVRNASMAERNITVPG